MIEPAISISVVDAILVMILLEGLGLMAWRKFRCSGPTSSATLANLAAGACLFLALRAILSGSSHGVIGLCLAAALIAHISDLAFRWRDALPASPTQLPGLLDQVSRDEVSHG